jgi:hypothetical protein
LQPVANLLLRGIAYPQGSFEVSTTHFMASSSPGFAWRNSYSNMLLWIEKAYVAAGDWVMRIGGR